MTAPTIAHATANTSDSDILSPEQKAVARLRGLGSIYQTTDRILTSGHVDVRVEHHPGMPAAAWTDGATITFNAALVDSTDALSIERMNGLNVHELAHVLYTPRKGTTLAGWVIRNGYMRAFNMLEDQRIETLLTARYPSAAPWLTATIARWVLSEDSVKETGYLFARGRRYLDGRLRGALRAAFIRQDLLEEVDEIIDEYRTMAFPEGYERAEDLIRRFNDVLDEVDTTFAEQNPGQPSPAQSDPHGHGERPNDIPTSGRPKGVSEQRRDSRLADEGEDEVDPTDDDLDEGTGDSRDSSDEGDAAGQGDGETDSEGDGQADTSDGQSGDASPDGQPGDGEGTPGSSPSDAQTTDETTAPGRPAQGAGSGPGADQIVDAVAQQVLDGIRNDAEIRDDIRRTQRQIQAQGGSDTLQSAQFVDRAPLPEYSRLLSGLRKSLVRLVAKADPGWSSRTSTGRVNALRWAQERDLDTAFDLWDEGVHDAVDMEVVVMVDESGSMSGHIEEAVNAMWVVKRALDKVGASTTVITFDNTSRILYHRKDKAAGQIRFSYHGGGTDPTTGLEQAAQIFSRSRKTQKILVVFTDGAWFPHGDGEPNHVTPEEYIARFNSAGVVTALGFMSPMPVHTDGIDGHGCALKARVNGESLATFVSTLVTTAIKARLHGR